MFPTVLSCNNKENIKSLSTLSQPKPTKEFLQWFVGFVDACPGGCFFITHKVNSASNPSAELHPPLLREYRQEERGQGLLLK